MTHSELVDEKFDLYRYTEEGQRVGEILVKLDRRCSPWMHADDVMRLKKELLVQIIEKGFVDEEISEHYTILE